MPNNKKEKDTFMDRFHSIVQNLQTLYAITLIDLNNLETLNS